MSEMNIEARPAERRAAPSRTAIPLGAEAVHKQSSGLFVPAEESGPLGRRGLQGRLAYSPDEGLA